MENGYVEALNSARCKAQAGIIEVPKSEPLDDYGLGGVDCPICGNSGYISYKKNGIDYARECSCMAKRRSIRRLRRSEMEDMIGRYSFASYQPVGPVRQHIKELAQKFAEEDTGWFFLSGTSGSGKTHICTAICSRLMDRGKNVRYMLWRDESRAIKARVNTGEADELLDELKRVDVLYIDDLFKDGCTEADVRLAFELINSRYNNTAKRTIISTEMRLLAMKQIDSALAGRIYERSKGYALRAPDEDWRFR